MSGRTDQNPRSRTQPATGKALNSEKHDNIVKANTLSNQETAKVPDKKRIWKGAQKSRTERKRDKSSLRGEKGTRGLSWLKESSNVEASPIKK